MGQYEQLLSAALNFIADHDVAFSVGFLLATQIAIWWMLARAISHLDATLDRPALVAQVEREDVTEPNVVPIATARTQRQPMSGNPILERLVTNLRDEFADPDCPASEHVERWQRRLARHGIVPPRNVAECDALLSNVGEVQ